MSDMLMAAPRLIDAPPAVDAPAVPDRLGQPRIVCQRIGPERYEVLVDWVTSGFVDVVGAVFVALRGLHYDRSIEIAQSLSFETAVAALAADVTHESA